MPETRRLRRQTFLDAPKPSATGCQVRHKTASAANLTAERLETMHYWGDSPGQSRKCIYLLGLARPSWKSVPVTTLGQYKTQSKQDQSRDAARPSACC